jgi:hypothetical protein
MHTTFEIELDAPGWNTPSDEWGRFVVDMHVECREDQTELQWCVERVEHESGREVRIEQLPQAMVERLLKAAQAHAESVAPDAAFEHAFALEQWLDSDPDEVIK